MAFIPFASIQSWVQSLRRGAKQCLRQWTRPNNSNDSLTVGTALDLTRSKSELVLENAVLTENAHPFEQPSFRMDNLFGLFGLAC